MTTLHDFTMKTITGEDRSLADFRGKVVLVVNVASRCGLTPHYTGLEALHRELGPKGLVVAGFPANDFGKQEPGTDEEIKTFCSTRYDVTFPMFSKITVLGPEKHPLYAFLVEGSGDAKEVSWNFEKFLVGKDGKVVARFAPTTTPDAAELREAVVKALG